jgi:hypothetical protein
LEEETISSLREKISFRKIYFRTISAHLRRIDAIDKNGPFKFGYRNNPEDIYSKAMDAEMKG